MSRRSAKLCKCGHGREHHTGPGETCVYGHGTAFGGCQWCRGWGKRAKQGAPPVAQAQPVDVPKLVADVQSALDRLCAGIKIALGNGAPRAMPTILETSADIERVLPRSAPVKTPRARPDVEGIDSALNKGALEILRAIAQRKNPTTSTTIAVLTGYRLTSRKTYLGLLVRYGCLVKHGDGYSITDAGRSAVGPVPAAPVGADLREHYLETLPEGEAVILEALLDSGAPLSTAAICEATNYQPTSVKTYVRKLCARELVVRGSDGYEPASELR